MDKLACFPPGPHAQTYQAGMDKLAPPGTHMCAHTHLFTARARRRMCAGTLASASSHTCGPSHARTAARMTVPPTGTPYARAYRNSRRKSGCCWCAVFGVVVCGGGEENGWPGLGVDCGVWERHV
eukprot:365051-Chlamydomonas_euryale.AAC.10